jgi:hypothetical protein
MSDDPFYRERRRTWRLHFTKALLFTLFLVYPGVSSRVLSIYLCKEVNTVPYLVHDFTLHCYTGQWNSYAIYAAVMVGVYPIGIPAFFFALLWKNRHKLQSSRRKQRLGFLYQSYSSEMWWWEMVEMGHKLCLTSLFSFLSAFFGKIEAQLCAGMALSAVYIITILVITHPSFHLQ